MVKGAARSGAAGGSSTSTTSTPQQLPTNIQAGQNPHDPLTLLNSSLAFGHPGVANFNPFAEMGLNPNDPNMMQTMMNSPQFLEQMGRMMSNPEILDQVIALNPQLAGMAPQMREMFSSEAFRQMMCVSSSSPSTPTILEGHTCDIPNAETLNHSAPTRNLYEI